MEQTNIKVGYREALRDLWKGTVELTICLAGTFTAWVLDCLRHYIATIVITIAFVSMFITMSNAKAERDHANIQAYHYEQACDSLKLMLGR